MTGEDSCGSTGSAVSSASSAGSADSHPRLVAVCGLPGVGKSTVAEFLTDRLDATRIRTDAVRQALIDDPQYTPEEKETVYQAIRDRARDALDAGDTVVLDATFARRHRRLSVRDLAEDCAVAFHLVKVTCDQSVAEDRIRTREGISDADIEVHREYRDEVFEPIDLDHVTIDNSASMEATRAQVEDLF